MASFGRRLILACSMMFVCWSFPTLSGALDELKRVRPITSGLKAPTAVAVDRGGRIYVTESSNNRLAIFAADGRFVSEIKRLQKPLGVAVDGRGCIFICTAGTGNVEVFDAKLTYLHKLGRGDGEFSLPVALAVDGPGNIYVVDAKEHRVKVYGPGGSPLFSFGGRGNEDGRFNFPTSIAIDAASGRIIVSDLRLSSSGILGARIQIFDSRGTFLRKFGVFGRGEGLLMQPLGVAVDGLARIFVSDAYQNVVQVFDGSGTYLRTLYDLANPMRTPLGVAIGPNDGNLYVASLNTGAVEVYGPGTPVNDGGGGGGTGDNTIVSLALVSSGGGCSIAVDRSGRPGAVSSAATLWPPAVLLLVLLAARIARRKAAQRGRHPKGP